MKLASFLLILFAGLALTTAAPAQSRPAYVVSKTVMLGIPDRWDYVVADPEGGRVYVAHSDRLDVIDSATGAFIGSVTGIPGGTHGVGISHALGLGFTDDGEAGEGIAFNPVTLNIEARIKLDVDADAIAYDGVTGHIFIIEGDPARIQVIDPQSRTKIATIAGGGKLEYGVADGLGHVFINVEAKSEIIRIDTRSNKIDARWPMPGCKSPHGLAVDVQRHRLFSGCANSELIVMNGQTGAVVATLAIGRGSDAIAFDAKRRRIFSANGADGTISVFQQGRADAYLAMETIKTAISARTMDVDSKTGRLFVAAADTDPPASPGGRARPRPGSLKLLMLDPVP